MELSEKLKKLLPDYQLPAFKPNGSFSEVEVQRLTSKREPMLLYIVPLRQLGLLIADVIKLVAKVRHPSVQDIVQSFEFDGYFCWIVEQPLGRLEVFLKDSNGLDQPDGLVLARQIIQGYVELKTYKINYPFLSLQNIVVSKTGQVRLGINAYTTDTRNEHILLRQVLESVLTSRNRSDLFPPIISAPVSSFLKALSDMSFAELMAHQYCKQKVKLPKKKIKDYVYLRQTQVKENYGSERIVFAVCPTGFCRLRLCSPGLIQEVAVQVMRADSSFLSLLRVEKTNKDKLLFVTEYANQGTLQSYLLRCKTKFSQQKIFFIMFSLLNFVAGFQKAGFNCHNFLHPRNLYISNGLIRVGQPTPLSEELKNALFQLREVNDYYCPQMKQAMQVCGDKGLMPGGGLQPGLPNQWFRANRNDCWSVGMVCYTIMYGDNAIFPNNHVRLPISPAYSAELKHAIELLLERNDPILSPVSLIQSIAFPPLIRKAEIIEKRTKVVPRLSTNIFLSGSPQAPEQFQQVEIIGLSQDYQLGRYALLEQSTYCVLRLATKGLCSASVIVALFFLPFLWTVVPLLAGWNSYSTKQYTINNLSSFIITAGDDSFTLTTIYELQTTYNCLNATNLFTQVWNAGPVAGLAIMCLLVLLKVGLTTYDWVKLSYEKERWSCTAGLLYFLVGWSFYNTLYSFFYVFTPWFYLNSSKCINNIPSTQSSALLTNQIYMFPFLVPHIACLAIFLLVCLSTFMRNCLSNLALSLMTSLLILALLAVVLLLRLGPITSFFYPAWMSSDLMVSLIKSYYFSSFCFFPELVWLAQMLTHGVIDFAFYHCEPQIKIAEDRYLVQKNSVLASNQQLDDTIQQLK